MEKFTADWIRLKMFPKEPPPIPLPIEISTLLRYTNGSVTYGTLIKFEFASTSSRATRVTWSYHPFAEPSNQEEVTSIQEMTDDWIKCILWTPGAR